MVLAVPPQVTCSWEHLEMLYAFTDESYSELHYYQAAYIITDSQLRSLESLVKEVMAYASRFSVRPDAELHGYSIMNAVNGWEPLKGRYQRKISVYKILLRGIAEIGGSLIIERVEENNESLQDNANKPRHLVTHSELMKKLNSYGAAQMREIEIYSDRITTAKEISDHFYRNRSGNFQYLNQLNFVNSSEYLGVQIVDVCLYIFQRAEDEARKGNQNLGEASKLWKHLKDTIYENFESDFLPSYSTEGPQ